MDDDRLRRQLNAADGPMQPPRVFRDGLKAQLLAELDLAEAPATPVGGAVVVRRRNGQAPGWWLVAAALVAIGIVGATLGAGAIVRWLDGQRPEPLTSRPGVLRVAVRPDGPQVIVPGLGPDGYDVDVAEELGRRTGLEVQLVVESPDQMLARPAGSWDVAMPSAWLPRSATDWRAATAPYYYWPVFLLAAPGQAATVADLDGATTVCVVAASSGEAWIEDRLDGGTVDQRVDPPDGNPALHVAADDDACLQELRDGSAGAIVTSEMTRSDADAVAGTAIVGDGPVLLEPRSMLLPGRADATTGGALRAAISDALAAMREDGTLARLSALRFGGEDLSTPPSP